MSLGNPSKRDIRESPPFWDGGDEEKSYRVAVLVSNDRAKINIVSIWAHTMRFPLKKFRLHSDMEAGIEKSMSVK